MKRIIAVIALAIALMFTTAGVANAASRTAPDFNCVNNCFLQFPAPNGPSEVWVGVGGRAQTPQFGPIGNATYCLTYKGGSNAFPQVWGNGFSVNFPANGGGYQTICRSGYHGGGNVNVSASGSGGQAITFRSLSIN